MSNLYSYRRMIFLLILTFGFKTSLFTSLQAQSLSCNGGMNISLDYACMGVISASDVLKGEPINLVPTNYTLIVKNKNGTIPTGIKYAMSANGPFLNGTQGPYIKFSGPGAYTVTVKRNIDNVNCWIDVMVEDKLPPKVQLCPCPDTATVVAPQCRFSCAMPSKIYQSDSITGLAGVNPEFYDNCNNLGDIDFQDELKRDSICGNWVIIRTWRSLIGDGHGGFVYKDLNCRQKFLFESVAITEIHPPKSKIIVECGTATDPISLRNHFSNKNIFPNAHIDSANQCVFPYMLETVTGVGTFTHVIGQGLTPGTNDDLCKITATYTDTEKIYECPYSYKFVRNWHIIDWCTNRTLPPLTQVIKVQDTLPPMFYIKDTIPAVSTDPWYCLKDMKVPPPDSIKDNCVSLNEIVWKAFVDTPKGKITADASNGYILKGLEKGTYDVTYMVTDNCGNTRVKKSKLTVRDDVPPIVLAKHSIIVTFSDYNGECFAKVYPENIDAGSFDACDGKWLIRKIRRKTDTIPHGDFVKFYETDIDKISPTGIPYGIVTVELKVTDKSGNMALAWTNVRVEDKNSKANIICGDTLIVLDCSADLDLAILKARPKAYFDGCNVRPIEIVDTIHSSNIHASCNTGMAWVDYRLKGSSEIICSKKFILRDADSLIIHWPVEELTVNCAADNFGDPVFENTNCNLLAKTVEKQVFDINPGQGICKKIVFRHTVIDWCAYQANQGDTIGIYRFNQIIKVKDNTKPVLTCQDTVVTASPQCRTTGIKVTAIGKDEGVCGSDLLKWEAKLDTNWNGTYDIKLSTVVGPEGKVTATINYPLKPGSYYIWWKATDDCGNSSEMSCKLTIEDKTPPVAQCISTISTTVMNTNGAVAIWAKDFDPNGKSIDGCGNPLIYSFSETSPNVPSMAFRCEDIPDGKSVVKEIPIYVYDQAGNKDVCWVKIRIDDTSDVCPDSAQGTALVSGVINTPAGDHVELANVQLESMSEHNMASRSTNVHGQYSFSGLADKSSYELQALKADDVLNGISTLDLILIQRHILGLNYFDSPYKTIAADANSDNKVSALDIVELRRLLLGQIKGFAHGQSWKFVNSEQHFEDVRNPWPLQERWIVDVTKTDILYQNFIAVKLGDVNGSAVANSLLSGARSSGLIAMQAKDKKLRKGDYVHLKLVLQKEQLYGMQLSLNTGEIQLEDIRSDRLKLDQSNWTLSPDKLDISWNVINPTSDEVDIQIGFFASRDGWISELFSINDSGLESEIYSGARLDRSRIELQFNREPLEHNAVFELYQNIPNPFNGQTVIPFYLYEGGDIELSVFDLTGRSVYSQKGNFKTGKNEIILQREQLKAAGVLYYQLNFRDRIATRKMILLD